MCGALVLCLPETAVVGTLGGKKDTLAENGILSGWGPAQPGGPGAWLPHLVWGLPCLDGI